MHSSIATPDDHLVSHSGRWIVVNADGVTAASNLRVEAELLSLFPGLIEAVVGSQPIHESQAVPLPAIVKSFLSERVPRQVRMFIFQGQQAHVANVVAAFAFADLQDLYNVFAAAMGHKQLNAARPQVEDAGRASGEDLAFTFIQQGHIGRA